MTTKHKWKSLDRYGNHCICRLCECEKKVTHSKTKNFHSVSYREENAPDFVRTRPVCQDKINLTLNFDFIGLNPTGLL